MDEIRFRIAFQMQRGSGKAFRASAEDPSGKSIGELLVRLKSFEQAGINSSEGRL